MPDLTLSPAPALTISREFTPGLSLLQTTAVGTQLVIGGISYSRSTPNCAWLNNSFSRNEDLASTYTASVRMLYRGGNKPEVNQAAAMFFEGTRQFGGYVKAVSEEPYGANPTVSKLTVEMDGYSSLLDRIVAAKLYTVPIGTLVSIIVYDLWYTHLRPLGITHNYGANPPVTIQPILFHYETLRQCFQTLLDQAPGWSIWITNDGELKLADTNGVGDTAPFELDRTGVNPALWDKEKGAVTIMVRASNEGFRNREFGLPSTDLVALFAEADQTGDGATTSFFTTYAQVASPKVLVAGVVQQCDEFAAPAGGSCYYINGGIGVFFHAAPALAAVVAIAYTSPWQQAAVAEDDVSIAAVGPFDHVTQMQNVTDWPTAQAVTQARLDTSILRTTITYGYNSRQQTAWLEPGMLQTVNWSRPDVSGVFTVRSVSSEEYGISGGGLWRHTVVLGLGASDVTGVTDAQALMQAALRRTNVNDPTRATLEIAIGVNLTTLADDTPNTYRFLGSGVIASWDARMLLNPPIGAPVWVNLKKNGVSIFPASSPFSASDIIVIPDGSTAEQSGFRFVSDNLAYVDGDILTAVIMQVGSTTPGKNLLVHLNLKPSLAVAA